MRTIKILVGLTVLFVALPAVAEEIIVFKSGLTLPIRSHQIEDGMVRVDLGDNSMMAFPELTIDRIEVAGKGVHLKRSYGAAANSRVPSPEGSFPVQGIRRPNPADREPIPTKHTLATPVKTDPRTGLAGYFPQGHRSAANRKKAQITGNMRVFQQNPTRQGSGETFTGTTQVGGRHIIGDPTPRRRNGERNPNIPKMVGLAMKDSNMDPVLPDPEAGSATDGSDN